ncbi:Hypothetical predicted protein [Octopus vulgaris]|uniref:Uncharacterized protein n=1 Tax=Octopus vulgaris TaxID=6645 RepID=A0AA36AIT2_OCTVU|nr:Hypothetical predicted protein [Octopus vulgaris]
MLMLELLVVDVEATYVTVTDVVVVIYFVIIVIVTVVIVGIITVRVDVANEEKAMQVLQSIIKTRNIRSQMTKTFEITHKIREK